MNMHACGKLNGCNDLVSLIRQTCDLKAQCIIFFFNYASDICRKILHMSRAGLNDFMYVYILPLYSSF